MYRNLRKKKEKNIPHTAESLFIHEVPGKCVGAHYSLIISLTVTNMTNF